MIDCRAYNGAQTDSEHGLDHAMVRACLRLRMKAARISSPPAKLDTAKLKKVALEHLRQDLRNRFEGLQLDEDASPEDEWREFKDAVADASQAHLGKTRRRRRDWVTGETIVLAEQARERDGSVIPDQARRLCRWKEPFQELLNHAAPPNTESSPSDSSVAENYPCEDDPPTLEEVCNAVRQLRNNRATGEDGIPAEVFKTCLDSLGPWLHRVITKLCLCEAAPNNWIEAVLLPQFKKADKRICPN